MWSNKKFKKVLTKGLNKLEAIKIYSKRDIIECSYSLLEGNHRAELLNDLLEFGDKITVVNKVVYKVGKSAKIVIIHAILMTKNILYCLDELFLDVKGSEFDYRFY